MPALAASGLGEAVLRVGVGDDADVRARVLQLLHERVDPRLRDQRIGAARVDEDAGLHLARHGLVRRRYRRVEGRHRGEVLAGARHVQRDVAAEAVADGADPLRVDLRLPLEELPRRLEARANHCGVFGRLRQERLSVLQVRRHLALAVHVEREADVARPGEPHGLVPRVLVLAPRLVDDEDARPLPLGGIIPGEETLQRRAALAVVDHACPHFRARGRPGQREESGGHPLRPVHAFLRSAVSFRARAARATMTCARQRREAVALGSARSA